jgi:hypothetical protein
MYVERDADRVPLSAYEFRQEWFYNDAKGITFVLDKDHKHYKKSDMPVFRARYANFGNFVFDGGATNVYAFIGYVPNTDLMTRGLDYGKMFITRDKVCDGTTWHTRPAPADPAKDPYFPINQAALTFTPGDKGIRIEMKTLTPNFDTFKMRVDGGDWKPASSTTTWVPHPGKNQLEARAVNRFGVDGPVSTVEIESAGPREKP